MSEFTQPGLKLDFQETTGRRAILLEEIRYEAGYKGSGTWLVVPPGFESDGASVPRPLWALLPPWGSKIAKAAILHDYLLDQLHRGRPVPGFETRKAIDDELHIALLALDLSKTKVTIVWLGVRGFSMLRGTILPKERCSGQAG